MKDEVWTHDGPPEPRTCRDCYYFDGKECSSNKLACLGPDDKPCPYFTYLVDCSEDHP
jgi:hypothetical protein